MPQTSATCNKYRIAVIGGGYVGLVSAACLADWGNHINVFEIDARKRARLQAGDPSIHEPGLEELLKDLRKRSLITFPKTLKETLKDTSAAFITVGTPEGEDGRANLEFVFQAAKDIALSTPQSDDPYYVIVKSTVPVGTCDKVAQILKKENSQQHFIVLSNPEFLREGVAIQDFKKPDRIVVGLPSHDTDREWAQDFIKRLYAPIKSDKLIFMKTESAELTKYASNAFLALKVGYINEIAELCENIGADALEVSHGMGLDPRIGARFLNPGPGVGGSCFPKDTSALASMARDHKTRFSIIDAAIDSNLLRIKELGSKVSNLLQGELKRKKIAVLGLTFKANTDDVRASPALVLIQDLLDMGASVNACDPQGVNNARSALKNKRIEWFKDPLLALHNCDAAVLLTEWDDFIQLTPDQIKGALKKPTLIDFRNLFDPMEMKKVGISYYAVGRPRPTDP